jgi:signal transduction histidine kinase
VIVPAQALAEGRQIQVKLDLEKLPPVSVNEAEIRELVTNRIFNAVDAMPAGAESLGFSGGAPGVLDSPFPGLFTRRSSACPKI